MVPEKTVSFAMLILHTNFVIPDEFNDVVECKTFLFSVLSIVILGWSKDLAEFLSFHTLNHEFEFSSIRRG